MPPQIEKELSPGARSARRHLLLLTPLTVLVLVLYGARYSLFGHQPLIRLAFAAAIALLGWAIASDLGRALRPQLAQMDARSAGTLGFLVRLVTLAGTILLSLRLAGIPPGALVAGASITAIVIGLAAQQTIGNVFAGLVLLSARPFSVGERVRFRGFGMDVEGRVISRGLLYVTLAEDDDLLLVPNATALTMSVRPLREPAAVELRARLPAELDPLEVEQKLVDAVSVGIKGSPHVELEEFAADEVVMRIQTTPQNPLEGGQLAKEMLAAVSELGASEEDRASSLSA